MEISRNQRIHFEGVLDAMLPDLLKWMEAGPRLWSDVLNALFVPEATKSSSGLHFVKMRPVSPYTTGFGAADFCQLIRFQSVHEALHSTGDQFRPATADVPGTRSGHAVEICKRGTPSAAHFLDRAG